MKLSILAATLACALAGPTLAAPPDRSASSADINTFVDPGNTMAKSYAADFNVSVGEATRRLKQLNQMSRLRERLLAKHPDTFAGLYALNKGQFRIMARFADATPDVAIEDPGLAGDLQNAPAARSLKTLKQDLGAIVDQHGGSGVTFNVALDEPGNIIVLYVTDAGELEGARKDGRLKLPGYVRIQQVPSLVEPTATAYAGRGYLEQPGTYCTTGFTMIQPSTGKKGVSTAGHCNNTAKYNASLSPSTTYNSTGGYPVTVLGEWEGNNMDLQWGSISGGVYPNQFWDGYQYTTVTGTIATSVGDYVCKFGRKSGRTCGTVEQYNYWVPNYGYMTKVVAGSPMNDFGDSGGPVFKGSLAAGWVHGKDGAGNLYYSEAYMPESKATGIRIAKNNE